MAQADEVRREAPPISSSLAKKKFALLHLFAACRAPDRPVTVDGLQHRGANSPIAFGRYIARIYAGYFRSFDGSVSDLRAFIHVGDARDAGAKGVLVSSEIRPLDDVAISVAWLVSDRSGKLAISDIVVEGVSLAVTQREIVAALFEKHDGDAGAVIARLEAVDPQPQP